PSASATFSLSLHDALPILDVLHGGSFLWPAEYASGAVFRGAPGLFTGLIQQPVLERVVGEIAVGARVQLAHQPGAVGADRLGAEDRKSTRLNSSHDQNSYA